MTYQRHRSKGFTLVELAMVLVIVALLAGGLLVPVSAQFETRGRSETQQLLNEAKEALYGYALTQGHLPCPATPGNESGLETRSAPDKCAAHAGLLPWATLGMAAHDAYGNHLRYSVAAPFADAMTPFGFGSSTDIRIKTRDPSGAMRDSADANAIVAVVLSHGRNGTWGYREGRMIEDTSGTNPDEDENGNGSGTLFFDRPLALDNAAPGGEFDDQLAWIAKSSLLSRMVAARKLP